jgi:hypothetical protein
MADYRLYSSDRMLIYYSAYSFTLVSIEDIERSKFVLSCKFLSLASL